MTEIPMPEDYREPSEKGDGCWCAKCCTFSIQCICGFILVMVLMLLIFTGAIGLWLFG